MANTVVPASSGAAADTSSGATPAAAIPGNGGVSKAPAADVPIGLVRASPASAMSTVSESSPSAGDPPPSGGTDEIGLAMQPVAGWQPADVFGTGQPDIWGAGSNDAWNATLDARDPLADYNVASANTFIGDSSMGDTLWYDSGGGNIDDSQIASVQSITGDDFGNQSPSTGGDLVTGNGGGAAQWPTG